jgi:hypothetical protein
LGKKLVVPKKMCTYACFFELQAVRMQYSGFDSAKKKQDYVRKNSNFVKNKKYE